VTDTCPSWPTILAWLENDLPYKESRLLNTHVADCDECREKLTLVNGRAGCGSMRCEVVQRHEVADQTDQDAGRADQNGHEEAADVKNLHQRCDPRNTAAFADRAEHIVQDGEDNEAEERPANVLSS